MNKNEVATGSKKSAIGEQKKLGVQKTDEGLLITIKFNCASDGKNEDFKLRAFKYKIQVVEKEKRLSVEGTQRNWLAPNLTVLKLKYDKKRVIDFKNVEISTYQWIRAFPEEQLQEPINLSWSECKDLGSY